MIYHEYRSLFVCAGFSQHLGLPNGTTKLFVDLGQYRSPHCSIDYLPWDAYTEQYAELLYRLARSGTVPRISIFSFSWGGSTARRLALDLQKRGLKIDTLVASDPVYRHLWVPRRWWILGSSLLRFMRIRIPDNVRRVIWFRQRQNRPMGHNLVAQDPRKTTIYPAVVLNRKHEEMDDAPQFHRECHQCAARW